MSALGVTHKERGERNRLLVVIVVAMIIAAAIGYGVDQGHRPTAADPRVKHQANSPPPESGPAWPIKLIATGNFGEVVAGDRVLYLTQSSTTGTRIVRMDPMNGRITARSAVISNASGSVFVDNKFFVTETTSQGASVLLTLNANTLNITRRLPIGTGDDLTPSFEDSLWIESTNALTRIDITNGAILARVDVVGINSAVLSTTGQRLYDTVQVTPETEVIQARDGRTGNLLATASPALAYQDNGIAVDAASAQRLFVAFNAMGLGGSLYIYNPQLRLVASASGGRNTNAHPTGIVIPGFAGDVGAGISGGIVWATGDDEFACFSARGELEAIDPPSEKSEALISGPVVVTNTGDYAFIGNAPGSGLVRIEPPKKCSV